jgi:hypothetical protein
MEGRRINLRPLLSSGMRQLSQSSRLWCRLKARCSKEATVKSFHYTSINELRQHVRDWLIAYNFAKQLKALRFRTPYEAIEELWKSKPDVFIVQPHHHMLGLNT